MDGTERVELFEKLTPLLDQLRTLGNQLHSSSLLAEQTLEGLGEVHRDLPRERQRSSAIAQFDSEAERWRSAYQLTREKLTRYRLRYKAEHGHVNARMDGFQIVPEGLLFRYNTVQGLAADLAEELRRLEPDNPVLASYEDDYRLHPIPTDDEREATITSRLQGLGFDVSEDD